MSITSCVRNELAIFLVIEYYVLKGRLRRKDENDALWAKTGEKAGKTVAKGKF